MSARLWAPMDVPRGPACRGSSGGLPGRSPCWRRSRYYNSPSRTWRKRHHRHCCRRTPTSRDRTIRRAWRRKECPPALQAIQLVQSREVKVGLLGQLDVQSVYIFPYLPWGLLVVLHFRDEHRHTFGHGGKSGVKAASATQYVPGRQCQWLSVAYLTYGTYHAAGYFPCFFHRFVAVAKGDGQGNAFPESLPVFHDKLFNAHNDCMMFKDSLFAAASFRLHAFTTLT